MEKLTATTAFFALSQQIRLDIFRMLVQAGEHGRHAGEIADTLGIRQNTLSNNLNILLNAGLVERVREGRNIRYTADTKTISELLSFLLEGCCQSRPEICFPLIERSSKRTEAPMAKDSYNVLFLCTGNSARSLMAEAIMNREGMGKFRAFSAGSLPSADGPHPYTVELLENLNHDMSEIRTKDWAEFANEGAPKLDFVFTVCDKAAAEVCPVWPGQPMSAHWGVPDPVAAQGNEAEKRLAFADAYRMLRNRISIFTNLPLETLDKFSLQRQLDEIGQTRELGVDI
ncbi:metalloregulator ArsR/SmtB family transcription factor [Aliiruegeria sabulilitoris]|uniref:metalloregulator ArsR/SmtB family transcription factor n=1 Tax=Aliiruegeria sabulilitoris TaxID=1510458 RepID=UPI00082ED47F|nr:metalloregulator ArsR/SmtB family transcription factor [Aliiruegeria sabulilitoris]NDR57226.1 metalloregulator ArsR/SmtB family transcription factor [Pseudoruegeria sp. M32A2M]